ncbi:TPA: hypothetical protein JLT62_001465 [Escherichia coli]|nr:hypothetical protein [Escherichia coli]
MYEFTPYSKQREFIDAGHDYPERCFMAGNQLGKSFTGAAEVAFHLTGRYGTAMNPATTGAAVSYGLLTRAYESEPFRNAMLRMANTPRGSTAFEKAMQQAQKAINALTQGAKSDALSE